MWSLHAEGRAVDIGVQRGGEGLGAAILGDLLEVGDLVLQRIIWWHRIYDLVSPRGRPYLGRNPHTDHLHVELSWPAARQQILVRWPPAYDEEDEPMPVLIVAFKGAQWAVSPDLTSRVGLAQSVDVEALMRLNGGRTYCSADLSDSLMARIPEVSAL